MQHPSLLTEIKEYKEAAQGVGLLKSARYNLRLDIKELIIREWGQLLDYQQAREQVRNASSKIETL